jgi:DNA-directed RNA polymerase specialized sigma24 family protein
MRGAGNSMKLRSTKRKLTIRTNTSRFDRLVARYYPAVYSLASRMTDDPRQAVVLAHDALESTRKRLGNRRDETAFASVLIAAVIRERLTTA